MTSMAPMLLVLVLAVALAAGDRTSHVKVSHGTGTSFQHNTNHHGHFGTKTQNSKITHRIHRPPTYKPRPHVPHRAPAPPTYPPVTEQPTVYEVEQSYETTLQPYSSPNTPPYSPPVHSTTPRYAPTRKTTLYKPRYTTRPSVYKTHTTPPHPNYEERPPACSFNTTKNWCIDDYEYPMYEIQDAAQKHGEKLLPLYADIADLSTSYSVEGLQQIVEETYLCLSETSYVRPLRAVNVDGKWRIIVNGIKVNYQEVTQTVRLEECLAYSEPCPLIPSCYESSCLQKSIYHRFLTYDPYDLYFPFVVESFKLPASCACRIGEFHY